MGGWELNEKPQDTDNHKWFESDVVPPIWQDPVEVKKQIIDDKKSAISAIELKNLRKLYDGEDMTAVNAERLKLRAEIQALEKPSAS